MTDPDLTACISCVVESAPLWVQTDLSSRDASIRRRTEETIAAMIASALTMVEQEDATSR